MSGSGSGVGKGGQSGGSQSIEQTQSMLSQLMLDILTESRCVDERSLCIEPGKLAWALYIDLICLNHDGNVQDACALAMISALETVLLPRVELPETDDGTTGQVRLPFPLQMIPLKLNCKPVCTTMFAIEEQSGVILMSDPNKQEEDFARTFIVICTSSIDKMCLMRKYGGGLGINQQQLDLCISRALDNGIHIRNNFFK